MQLGVWTVSNLINPRPEWICEITDLNWIRSNGTLPTKNPDRILPKGTHHARTYGEEILRSHGMTFSLSGNGSNNARLTAACRVLHARSSYLSHNCCLWIPVCIHTCSLSGRSHSSKMQSGGRCYCCRRSGKRTHSFAEVLWYWYESIALNFCVLMSIRNHTLLFVYKMEWRGLSCSLRFARRQFLTILSGIIGYCSIPAG